MTARKLLKTFTELQEEARERFRSAKPADVEDSILHRSPGLEKQVSEKQAQLDAAGGRWEFWGLYTLDGKRVAAKQTYTRYGVCWAICDRAGEFVRFVPWCKAAAELHGLAFAKPKFIYPTKAHLARELRKKVATWEQKHQLTMKWESAPAVVRVNGHDLAREGSAWAEIVRDDGGWSGEVIYLTATPAAESDKVTADSILRKAGYKEGRVQRWRIKFPTAFSKRY